ARRSGSGRRCRGLTLMLLMGNLADMVRGSQRREGAHPMTSEDNPAATADAIPVEEAILSQDRGDVWDPIHRVSYSFRHEDSDLWVYTWLEDEGHLPEHYHPSLEEHWETLEGAARVRLDGTWRDLVPPDGPIVVAPGVRHELKNDSGRVARMRTRVAPGGRLDEFLIES